MRSTLKQLVEAALFLANGPLRLKELSGPLGCEASQLREVLEELVREYSNRGVVVEKVMEDCYWMRIPPELEEKVSRFAQRLELPKPVLRTLATIAVMQPLKLSKLVELRGTKAYEHVRALEAMGLVYSKKQGKVRVLRTGKKFRDYFGIDPKFLLKRLGISPSPASSQSH